MKEKRLLKAMSQVDEKYIEEASPAQRTKRPGWLKWGVVAACIAVIAVLGAGMFQSGLFGNKTDIAALDNGDKIVFAKSETAGSSIDIDGIITTRQLTEEEMAALFPDMPVTAHAVFMTSDMDSGNSRKLIGFEGNIGNIKMVVSTSDIQLLDTVIIGDEGSAEINGTNITAGYFVTDPNSKGEQNAIYYAALEFGSCKIYLENSGTKDNREATKNQLVEVIQKLIENGDPDLTPFVDSEAGAGVDGNPDGYDPLPNSQTPDEEVSAQDERN